MKRTLRLSLAMTALWSSIGIAADGIENADEDKVSSGEAGYAVGCSAAMQACIKACWDKWSDAQKEQFRKRCESGGREEGAE